VRDSKGGVALPPQDAQERLELGAVVRDFLRRGRGGCGRPRGRVGVERRRRRGRCGGTCGREVGHDAPVYVFLVLFRSLLLSFFPGELSLCLCPESARAVHRAKGG